MMLIIIMVEATYTVIMMQSHKTEFLSIFTFHKHNCRIELPSQFVVVVVVAVLLTYQLAT